MILRKTGIELLGEVRCSHLEPSPILQLRQLLSPLLLSGLYRRARAVQAQAKEYLLTSPALLSNLSRANHLPRQYRHPIQSQPLYRLMELAEEARDTLAKTLVLAIVAPKMDGAGAPLTTVLRVVKQHSVAVRLPKGSLARMAPVAEASGMFAPVLLLALAALAADGVGILLIIVMQILDAKPPLGYVRNFWPSLYVHYHSP